MIRVVSILSLFFVLVGGALAAVADHRPAFERAGGFLVIGGLAMVGAGLPVFR